MDLKGIPLPEGMKLVDFVLKGNDKTYLLEIKDPSHPKSPRENQANDEGRIKSGTLISDDLVPKARDSYTFLHLMKEDGKPFTYLVLLALDAWSKQEQKALLVGFKDRLAAKLAKETDRPWRRKYMNDCAVLTVDSWKARFPEWNIHRVSP